MVQMDIFIFVNKIIVNVHQLHKMMAINNI